MAYIADITIIIIILASAYSAYRKGFFRTLLSLLSGFISIGISFLFQPVAYAALESSFVKETVKNAVASTVPAMETSVNSEQFINSLNFPEFMKSLLKLNNNAGIYNALDAVGINEYIIEYVTGICLQILSFILTYIVISVVFFVLRRMIYKIRSLPVLKQFDSLIGAVLGILRGILLSFIVAIAAIFIQPYDSSNFLKTTLDNSVIIQSITQGSIFESIIKSSDISYE